MKRHFLRTITLTSITFLLGSSLYYLSPLEATLGLDTLFKIRSVRPPPTEVVVVAMDEASETRLGVGQDLTRWRGFHAKLINQLQRQGAALIIFDLQFISTHPDHDAIFAAAMRKAGNVLVADCIQKLRSGDRDFYGREECSESNKQAFVERSGENEQPLPEQLTALRKIPPTRLLAESALDHAPFYLTNDAENATIRESWTFIDPLAETPVLPVVAWFYYLQHTGDLDSIAQPNSPLSVWLTAQRRQCWFRVEPLPKSAAQKSAFQKRVDQLICGEDSRYLDFYGPPQTIRMESYSDVYTGKVSNLQGKVVFVGKANRQYSPGKTDFFQTPYTDTQSGKMAGVEIMATQFANLLEDRFIEAPLPPYLLLLGFGLLASGLLTGFSGLTGMLLSLLAGGIYVGVAVGLFYRNGWWLPVAVPILAQLPVAVLLSLLWSRQDLLDERKRILAFVRQVFPQWLQYLPSSPGHWYPEKNAAELTSERDVWGLCVATDIEGYTAVAARHNAHQMWALLSEYYQILGQSVHAQQGIIADIAGDAMMAVWINSPVEALRLSACLAALDIGHAVEQFNASFSTASLPTRIGLYEGDMTLGRLGSGEASHYRAIGDTVNTAARIQGVNKLLGTQILASKAIAANLVDVICRPVGAFRLVGREAPVELIEVVGLEINVNASQYAIHEKFAQGLSKFQQGQWADALADFQRLLADHGDDGPTRFYLDLASIFQKTPPLAWNGVVTLDGK